MLPSREYQLNFCATCMSHGDESNSMGDTIVVAERSIYIQSDGFGPTKRRGSSHPHQILSTGVENRLYHFARLRVDFLTNCTNICPVPTFSTVFPVMPYIFSLTLERNLHRRAWRAPLSPLAPLCGFHRCDRVPSPRCTQPVTGVPVETK